MSVITRARASALLFSGAALSAIRVPGRAQSNATIRVAILPIDSAAEIFYAKELGFFGKAHLDPDVQTMQATGPVAAALASGEIDIGFVAIDVLATAHDKHIPLLAIAPASEYLFPITARVGGLIVPANSPIHQAKDLNGKVIAAPGLHSFATSGPCAWIDQHGGDSSTVKFVELPFPAMPAALEAGRIDAASVAEPFVTLSLQHSRMLADDYESVSKDFLISAWVATPQWAQEHPDLVQRFSDAIRTTASWANANHTQSGTILAKYSRIDPAVIAVMTRAHYAERLTTAIIQPMINVSAKYNGFSPFPAEELIYRPSR